MMRTIKKWIAPVLAIAIAFSDCGGTAIYAAENDAAVEVTSVSENNTSSDETPDVQETLPEKEAEYEESVGTSEKEDTNSIQNEVTASKGAIETKLPALHIGHVKKGEELPDLADSEFTYDLPISTEASERIVLFTNYSVDADLDKEENGTLVWSILRGEKGTTPGSVSLIDEEDDWTDFETVSDSPYFTLTEDERVESSYYKTAELTVLDAVTADDAIYDYYIRAAYYLDSAINEDAAFYTAATVPFLPQPDADVEETMEHAADDTVDAEGLLADHMSGESSVSENTTDGVKEEIPDDELDVEENDTEEALDEALITAENDTEQTPVQTVSENDVSVQPLEEPLSTLSENTVGQQSSADSIGALILNRDYVTLHPTDRFYVNATIVPAEFSAPITWTSSNEAVATVNTSGRINAVAEGTAQITAVCGEMSATVRVEVVDSGVDDVTDLSGDIWVSGFQKESDTLVYTGQKITQDIRVYHNQTLLKEKTDYTLSYKNNINAAAWNDAKAPSITITMKGQYSGSVTLYYTIKPVDIRDINIYDTKIDGTDEIDTDSAGYEQAVTYAENLKIPNPVLTFGKKTLAAGKDFTCDYSTLPADYKKGSSYEAGKVYHYTVNGIGNFTGTIPMRLVVVKDKNLNFDSASVTLGEKQYEYHGTDLSKSDVTIKELKLGSQVLASSLYDYEVCTNVIENAYVMVYPTAAGQSAGYRGCKKVHLKLVGDRDIREASSGENWKDNIPFSQTLLNEEGGIFQRAEGLLVFGPEKSPLKEGTDYTVKYGNAQKVGKVTVTFTGKGRYKGTLKKTYQITPNIDNGFIISWKNVTREDGTLVIAYQKGGAVPDFILKDQDNNILKIKTDYTVKCINNKTPGETMNCEITGKGNYKGFTKTVTLKVKNGDISRATMTLPDKPYSTNENAWKSKPTIKDVNGKSLSAGTDYEKEFTYEYANNGQSPAAGTTILVTVQGKGCYEGSVITGSYRIFANSISKWIIVIDPQEYTGQEITLGTNDIHVYASRADQTNKDELKNCYEIVEYKNNIKAGTAKVTLRGTGDYGGTKTCSFKIQKKTYRINQVKGITLDKTNLALSLAESSEEKRTLTAKLTTESSGTITNPTVIWSSSNSQIADVDDKIIDSTTVIGIINIKKEGTVTITATTQDGNKKAQCKVVIVDAPLLKEADQAIEKEVGETYQLELVKTESQNVNPGDITWESSHPDVVTIEKDGLFATLNMKKQGSAVIQVTYKGYVQKCYVIVKGDEQLPEGKVYTYRQESGTTDDTPYINKCLRDWEDNQSQYDYMYIPAGVYHINPAEGGTDQFGKYQFGGIILTDNQKLVMSPSALLIAVKNNKEGYHIIWAFGRDNISISGGQIIGERNEHTGTKGEWGHGIQISGCTNVTIENVEISQCWGDGIYLGEYSAKLSNNVTITNCNLHHNRRSNLSITDASNITVRNCQFNYAKGTDPQYGIDIEPNRDRTCSNVTISNCSFRGNAKGTIQVLGQLNAHVKDVTIENCTGDKEPVIWSGFGGSVSGVKQTGNKWQ